MHFYSCYLYLVHFFLVGIVLSHALMEPASESCLRIIIVMPAHTVSIELKVLHSKLELYLLLRKAVPGGQAERRELSLQSH